MSTEAALKYMNEHKQMVQRAKSVKPTVRQPVTFGRIEYAPGTNKFTMGDGTPAEIIIPEHVEYSLDGETQKKTSAMRLLEVTGTWRSRWNGDRTNVVGAGFVVEISIGLINEKIVIHPGDESLILPGYESPDDEAQLGFADWRAHTHTIRGRIWIDQDKPNEDSLKTVVALQNLLKGQHGFAIDREPKFFDRTTNTWVRREGVAFTCTPPATPRDHTNEPVWCMRGAPVSSFEMTSSQIDPDNSKSQDRFHDLASGSTAAMLQYLIANDETQEQAIRSRSAGVQYAITGWVAKDDRNKNLRHYAKEARLIKVNIGGVPIDFDEATSEVLSTSDLLDIRPQLTSEREAEVPAGPDGEAERSGDLDMTEEILAAAERAAQDNQS